MGYNYNYNNNNSNMYGEPLGYGLVSGTTTTTADTLIPPQMYNTTIAWDSIPVKTPDSGLTYSTVPLVVSKKRPRDAASVGIANNHRLLSFPANNTNNTNPKPCGSVTFLGQDFSSQIHQQQSEVDQLIAQHVNDLPLPILFRIFCLFVSVGCFCLLSEILTCF